MTLSKPGEGFRKRLVNYLLGWVARAGRGAAGPKTSGTPASVQRSVMSLSALFALICWFIKSRRIELDTSACWAVSVASVLSGPRMMIASVIESSVSERSVGQAFVGSLYGLNMRVFRWEPGTHGWPVDSKATTAFHFSVEHIHQGIRLAVSSALCLRHRERSHDQ